MEYWKKKLEYWSNGAVEKEKNGIMKEKKNGVLIV